VALADDVVQRLRTHLLGQRQHQPRRRASARAAAPVCAGSWTGLVGRQRARHLLPPQRALGAVSAPWGYQMRTISVQ
jgi:hypothetical protein